MELRCDQNTNYCHNYIPDHDVGFKIVTPKKGDHYCGRKFASHSLVFLLEGEVEFSYNEYLNRRFKKGELFLIPQASEMYGIALSDARMVVLSFNNRIESLCDRCRLVEYTKFFPELNFDFKPLRMTETLESYIKLLEEYLCKNIRCLYLHKLKQNELFIIFGAEYDKRVLIELFYPITGKNIDFRSRILEHYRHGVDVAELAKKFGMSYSPFLRRFKKEFGESVQAWMLKQKAKHVKLRLSAPSTTISDILHEFKFSDLPHFIRFCRKQYGCTPKELLREIRSKTAE